MRPWCRCVPALTPADGAIASRLLDSVPHLAAHGPLALNPLDPHSLLSALGALGVFLVLFAETGLLIGFFLPGDSLLFTAGLLCTTSAARVHLSLPSVLVAAAAGALLGAQVGYLIGRRAGPRAARHARPPAAAGRRRRAARALDRYGTGKAIVLARFIPLVRTVLNPMAGTVGVPVRVFTLWQVDRRPGLVARRDPGRLRARARGSRTSTSTCCRSSRSSSSISLIPVALEVRRSRARG